jgi:signal transduction histidine kinase
MPVENLPAVGAPGIVVPPAATGDRKSAFTNNALLAGIRSDVLDQIVPHIETLTYAGDEIVFAEDDPGECLYLIAQGSIKISKRGRAGQQETLTHLLENDYFGEMALVDGGKRSAQATAAGNTVLGRIDRETWNRLLRLAPNEVLSNFTRSVTQRLRQNNQHFIEHVMRSERLSLLGTTISSIVHDMNNPISTILGACQVISSQATDDLINQMARLIREAIDRMDTMTRELIDFSRGETQLRLQLVSVPELVRQLEPDFAKCRVACEVQINVNFKGSLRIDLHRVVRVFGNLIRNAREAMKAGDANVLRFSVQKIDSLVQFELSDTGHGIKSDVLPTIFEPFVTHGKANGTGLGLAISKACVDAHGGNITVQSNEGGTTFRIDFPLLPEKEK